MHTDVTDGCTRSGFFRHFSVNFMSEKFYSPKPEHYDAQHRIRKRATGQGRRRWRESRGYQKTRRRLATTERKLAAHRRSLHGKLAHEIMRLGDDLRIEKVSYKGWQRCFGKSVGLRAPGRFVDAIRCVVARTRTAQLHEIPTYQTK